MECPNCRVDVPEHAKFCSQCGLALVLNCPSCGNNEPPGSNFCTKCGASFPVTGGVPASPGLAPSQSPRTTFAERCQLTVMFCDLVGSTALSVHLDVEDFHEVIAAYQKRVAEIVTGFDGFVARRVGDGVLVYFGFPHTGEDDAEQALRASLALVDGIAALESREPLQVRIGIATGVVVVGDLAGSGIANDTEVLGEGPKSRRTTSGCGHPQLNRDRG